jgi:3-hydroxyacyl-CoA dehydrogenase/enoyl-CoA hydratase/3-hydroxybutyryl-CoA epimerase/3-hydroxyacyl-CoA dehydrogenase/enoyl-CoA hydratase/3-hydroxybutyryl-CoA epimerase/enoyl-CoA isomerase
MEPFETLSLRRSEDGMATLAFLVPGHGQNILTPQVVSELARALDFLAAGPPPTGLIVSSERPGSFFAGADIERLAAIVRDPPEDEAIERVCDAGRAVFGRLSAAAWPSVAVIDGVCLGGGLELALACDFRIATDSPTTSLGLPEVKLGVLPGWGGTVRLPRLIGPAAAIELAASGEPIDADAARRLGLVDAVVPAERALASAHAIIRAAGARAEPVFGAGPIDVRARRERAARPVGIAEAEKAFMAATISAAILGRTGGHYPAPQAILEVVLDGIAVDAAAAERLESRAFARLARTPVSRDLVHLFRSGERNRRRHPAADRRPERVAIVGGGVMGAGIAAASLRAGMSTAVADTSESMLEKATATILDEASWDRTSRRSVPERAVQLASRLRTASRLAVAADAELVIEAVTEKLDVKRGVFAELERLVGQDAVLATNPSTYRIAKIAAGLEDRSRICGIHFFVPVRKRPLVEVVRGGETSDRTIAIAVAFARAIGKLPIVVGDSPGFLVNRLLMPYLHESIELVREGVAIERIDRAAKAFGMPVGPLELYDLIGLDTALYAGSVMSQSFGDRIEASPVIPAMVRAGLLGQKSGAGFYLHGGRDQPLRPNPSLAKLLEPYAIEIDRDRSDTHADGALIDRLFLPMVLEATLALDENVVDDPGDVDLAMVHGLGFPAFRGGLLAWADSLGAAAVVRRLEPLAPLGIRMRPTRRLEDLARSGGGFHAR